MLSISKTVNVHNSSKNAIKYQGIVLNLTLPLTEVQLTILTGTLSKVLKGAKTSRFSTKAYS